ncbi:MAG TPA: TetR/AcrR family transcriptional regulator [Acidimicrobiales bacterium]|jgi:AcrR family transcriptional regulator|nr:TetR/AcrR family transcriptional regulator [Acidimicrobiales bacterium]
MPRAKLRTPALKEKVIGAAVSTFAQDASRFSTRQVARDAGTSPAAIYELFDDRSGLLRAVFFEGFRLLGGYFERIVTTEDAVEDLRALFDAFRQFVQENPGMANLMFSRPFPDFHPGPDEAAAGAFTRRTVTAYVGRCIEAGRLVGTSTDLAHVLLALAQGLALQESAGWLGSSVASTNRRWALAFDLFLRPSPTSVATQSDGA